MNAVKGLTAAVAKITTDGVTASRNPEHPSRRVERDGSMGKRTDQRPPPPSGGAETQPAPRRPHAGNSATKQPADGARGKRTPPPRTDHAPPPAPRSETEDIPPVG